ncbi:MAG: M14 family zinc carboxypeptidase [Kiritimatiellae bacterium]|nr:M14 family zinc carboxypeptidase [Kiritimatiellia bacterium]
MFVLRGAVQVNEASGEPVDLCAAGEGVRAMAGETLPVKFVAESLEAHGLVAAAQERLASREPAETFEFIDRVAEIWGEQYLPRLASTVSTIHGRMIVRKGFGRGAVAYARKKTKEEKMGIQKTVAGMAAATLLGAGAANGNVIDFRSAVRAEPDLIHHYTFESPREDDHLPRLKDWAGGVDLAETNRKTTAKVQYVEGFDTQCGAAGKAGFSPASYDTGAAWFMTNAVALPNTLTVECIVSFYTNSASVNTYIVAYRPTAEERGYFVRLTNGGQLQTLIGTSVNDAKTIVPEVAFDNWYYIANTYTVSGGKTTINCYYADLTGGGALQHVVVDAEANGHYGVSGQLSLGMLYGTWKSVCEYYSPCLIDEVAIYNTAQSFETIKKRFDTLKMPAPVLEYREIFPNDDSAARNFPQEGWQVYRTGSGTYYSASECQIASSAVYTSFLEDLAAVASFPTRTGVTHGYVNINGIAADVDTPYFFWTDELTNRIDVGWLKLIKFDGNMRTNNYEGRVALRIDTGETPDHPADDVWYVSSDFNNPSGTGLFQFPQGSSSGSTHTAWKRYWLDVPGAEWAVLNFVPNTSMSVGDTKAVFPTNGLVTAVGIYHERHKHEQHGRYDNFTVYATRVYPPPPRVVLFSDLPEEHAVFVNAGTLFGDGLVRVAGDPGAALAGAVGALALYEVGMPAAAWTALKGFAERGGRVFVDIRAFAVAHGVEAVAVKVGEPDAKNMQAAMRAGLRVVRADDATAGFEVGQVMPRAGWPDGKLYVLPRGFRTDGMEVLAEGPDNEPGLVRLDIGGGRVTACDMLSLREPFYRNIDAYYAFTPVSGALGNPPAFGQYYPRKWPYSGVVEEMRRLAEKYPEISLEDEGDASGGYRMWSLNLGTPGQPLYFLYSSAHGSEWEPGYGLMTFARHLAEGRMQEVVDLTRVRIKIIPLLNPSGYDKMRRQNANGVDLNRQGDYRWERYKGRDSNNDGVYGPHDYDWKGSAPFTEPEAVAYKRIISDPALHCILDFHGNTSVKANKFGILPVTAHPENEERALAMQRLANLRLRGRHLLRQNSEEVPSQYLLDYLRPNSGIPGLMNNGAAGRFGFLIEMTCGYGESYGTILQTDFVCEMCRALFIAYRMTPEKH